MNKEKNKDILILVLLLTTILSIGSTLYFLFSKDIPVSTEIEPTTDQTVEKVEKSLDSIAIPGYEALVISKATELCLSNPPQNMCYFVITLSLEDGTILWQSDYVEPGSISDPIILKQELPNGTYPNACLKYSCFAMNESLTPLNGAETKLTLRVQN